MSRLATIDGVDDDVHGTECTRDRLRASATHRAFCLSTLRRFWEIRSISLRYSLPVFSAVLKSYDAQRASDVVERLLADGFRGALTGSLTTDAQLRTQAHTEAEIEPDALTDDRWREAITLVERQSGRRLGHDESEQTAYVLTMPASAITARMAQLGPL